MDWVTCSHSPACTGIARPPYGLCLSHLAPHQLDEELAAIRPGRLLDLRGTRLDADLLARVVEAAGRRPGRTRLDHAHFPDETRLSELEFAGDLTLENARFDRLASFYGSRFLGNLSLAGARFCRELSLHGARVHGYTSLDRAMIGRDALFGEAVFARGLSCERARFDGFATFDGALIGETACFRGARFGRTLSFRKVGGSAAFEAAHLCGDAYLSSGGRLSLARARADGLVDLSVHGNAVDLRRLEVGGQLLVRLTDARADLEGAVLRGRATISGRGLAAVDSLRAVDAPELTLRGLDLASCRMAGLVHPGGLRVKDCSFALTPRGVRLSLGWPPLRWFSRRRTLADEHGWRGWNAVTDPGATPDRLASLYTSLREGVDDERTSADFAFGAMEMRRQASRRWWLSMYWLFAGYGLRLSRTLAWALLVVAVALGTVMVSSASHASHRPSGKSGVSPIRTPAPRP
ncbi:pentapeptide repeat-containing protein [Nonomuraea sp. NPDC050663]|uniref:pentapeptide repeat-containing protein n=1 Tax=Nonomuraea sp. NPDC050663 TaxID=3364370 RepID=UPI00378A68E8